MRGTGAVQHDPAAEGDTPRVGADHVSDGEDPDPAAARHRRQREHAADRPALLHRSTSLHADGSRRRANHRPRPLPESLHMNMHSLMNMHAFWFLFAAVNVHRVVVMIHRQDLFVSFHAIRCRPSTLTPFRHLNMHALHLYEYACLFVLICQLDLFVHSISCPRCHR